ncbi:MAG: thioredoxin domain-containing protein [Candidatus Yonathbacteria bacterium]|nr:thioredoxin domain-containing protein [Candidatus Yonathbacteria bacterium]NTW47801.1 thioredoxin domain-containing protein [Candidatus Yonathbacteria bacterium]
METDTAQQKTMHPALMPIAVIIAGALIGAGIYFSRDGKTANNTPKLPEVTVIEGDHILGSQDAKITIIEYSDLECPFCKRFHETTNRLFQTYGANGDIALVFRHFPLDSLHQQARPEAEATECVAELGGNDAFWSFLNAIYATTTSNDGLDLTQLPVMATQAGVDATAFTACTESGRHAQTVQDDQDGALTLGVEGTPYSVFLLKDGSYYTVGGAYPYELLDITVQATLAGAPAEASQGLLDLIAAPGATDAKINAYIAEHLAQYLPQANTAPTTE